MEGEKGEEKAEKEAASPAGHGQEKKRPAEEAGGSAEGGGGSAAKRARTEGEGADGPPAPQGLTEPLLLACRYFDTECAGYLETDDLEEILYMTNADVSRRVVQALVDTVSNRRGRFSYQDFAKLEVPISQATPSAAAGAAAVGGAAPPGAVEGPSGAQVGRAQAAAAEAGPQANGGSGAAPVVASNGMVLLNGVLLNVQALQSKLGALADARHSAELAAHKAESQAASAHASTSATQKRVDELERAKAEAESAAAAEVAALKQKLAEAQAFTASFSTAASELQGVRETLDAAMGRLQSVMQQVPGGSGSAAQVKAE